MEDISKMSWRERKEYEKRLREESQAPSKVFDLSCAASEKKSDSNFKSERQVAQPESNPSSSEAPTEPLDISEVDLNSTSLFNDVHKVMVCTGFLCFFLGYCSSWAGEKIEQLVEQFNPEPIIAAIERFEMPELFETSFQTAVRSGKWQYLDCSRLPSEKRDSCFARRSRQERTWRQITFDRPGTDMYQFKLSTQSSSLVAPPVDP